MPSDKGANAGLKVASLVAGMVRERTQLDDMAYCGTVGWAGCSLASTLSAPDLARATTATLGRMLVHIPCRGGDLRPPQHNPPTPRLALADRLDSPDHPDRGPTTSSSVLTVQPSTTVHLSSGTPWQRGQALRYARQRPQRLARPEAPVTQSIGGSGLKHEVRHGCGGLRRLPEVWCVPGWDHLELGVWDLLGDGPGDRGAADRVALAPHPSVGTVRWRSSSDVTRAGRRYAEGESRANGEMRARNSALSTLAAIGSRPAATIRASMSGCAAKTPGSPM